jgi:hypothetical protein
MLFSNSGRGSKLSTNILAGFIVFSAVEARPPHDGVNHVGGSMSKARRRLSVRQASSDLTTAIVPAGTSFPAVAGAPYLPMRGTP